MEFFAKIVFIDVDLIFYYQLGVNFMYFSSVSMVFPSWEKNEQQLLRGNNKSTTLSAIICKIFVKLNSTLIQ